MAADLPYDILDEVYVYSPVGILTVNYELDITKANPYAATIFKVNPVDSNVKRFIPQASHGKHDRFVKELLERDEKVFNMSNRGTLKCLDAEQKNIYLDITIIVETDSIILICLDVTDKERAAIFARERELETEQILNGIVRYNYSYSMRDRDGKKIFTISPNLKELFGYKDEDIPSEYEGYIPWFSRVPETHRARAIAGFERFIKNSEQTEIESIYPFTDASGNVVNIQSNSVKILDPDGNFKGIVGSIRRLDDVINSLGELQNKADDQTQLNQRQVNFNKFILRSILLALGGFVWFAGLSIVRGDNRAEIDKIAGLAEILLIIQLLPVVVVVGYIVYKILILMGEEQNKNA